MKSRFEPVCQVSLELANRVAITDVRHPETSVPIHVLTEKPHRTVSSATCVPPVCRLPGAPQFLVLPGVELLSGLLHHGQHVQKLIPSLTARSIPLPTHFEYPHVFAIPFLTSRVPSTSITLFEVPSVMSRIRELEWAPNIRRVALAAVVHIAALLE